MDSTSIRCIDWRRVIPPQTGRRRSEGAGVLFPGLNRFIYGVLVLGVGFYVVQSLDSALDHFMSDFQLAHERQRFG